MAASLLGAAALFFPMASPPPANSQHMVASSEAQTMTSVSELAAPLLHREFTSSCLNDQYGFYRETLSFAENAITTFARTYYADAECREPGQRESIQEGRYALAEEEAGQLLLIVRNLQDKKASDVTPYFEALIKVDREQLVMQNSPSTSLLYTASVKSI
jgi:hypothetical protein